MIYTSFALSLLSGASSVVQEVLVVLGSVLLAAYLFGLYLVPRPAVEYVRRIRADR